MLPITGPFTPFIHACDAIPRPRPWELPRRRLAHWLIVTSLNGTERIVVNDAMHPIRSGSSYLIQPNALHDLHSSTGNQPAWIHFDVRYDDHRHQHPHAGAYDDTLGDRTSLLQPTAMEAFGFDLPVIIPDPCQRVFRDTVPRIISLWQRGTAIDVWNATHALTGLLLHVVEHLQPPRDGDDTVRRLEQAEATALRSLHTTFGLAEFAASAGLSRSRFCAVFSAKNNESPATWLRRHRLQRAQALLQRKDLPIAHVGSLVGYDDPTVFGRTFRSATGMTPGQWRERSDS